MTEEHIFTLFLYDDTDVITRKVPDEEMYKADSGRQAQLIVGFLCRSVPDKVVREFCELTGADYKKILVTGATSQTPKHRMAISKGKGQKLNEIQVRMIRISKKSNIWLGRKFGVSERTIRDVKRGVSYTWVTEVTDEDVFNDVTPIREGEYDANRN